MGSQNSVKRIKIVVGAHQDVDSTKPEGQREEHVGLIDRKRKPLVLDQKKRNTEYVDKNSFLEVFCFRTQTIAND